MPPILWAFFILVGVGTVPPVIGGLTKGVDPNVRHKGGASPQAYRVWSAPASRTPSSGCAGTTFAMAAPRTVRLQVDGQEQILDSSWSFNRKLNRLDYETHRYVFIDPVTQEELACRETRISCDLRGRDMVFRHGQGLCMDSIRKAEEELTEPVLEILAPRFVNATMRQVGQGQWQGDFDLRIVVRIRGPMNEKWWCPEVEVEWPDRTFSRKGSDCDPWVASEEQKRTRFSWTFSHRLIPGDNEIKVRLRNSGGVFHADRVRVTVR